MTVRPIRPSILDRLPPRKPPANRLAELREYADGLALRAEYLSQGNVKDLEDIVKALDELRDLREWAKAHTNVDVTNEKPMPKRRQTNHASKAPKPKRVA